ncbi:MAG TPA: glycosyltransferase [Bacillus sp. (in: firmicutes)]|nr:glycosyltransferase [Bacillus sp. (in: firmicutes)]
MGEKLKILHANTGLVAGGAERLIAEILPIMKDAGHEVEILLLEDKGNNIFEQDLKRSNIKINTLRYNNKFDFRNFFAIRKIIKGYDIVHAHIFPAQYWIPLATIGLRKKPIIITTEHNTHNRRRDRKAFQIIEKFIYSLYDRVISISPESEENLLDWLKIKKNNKYEVILNGVNLHKFEHAQPVELEKILSARIELEDRFLLMVARFDEQKDHETLFKAVQLLPGNVKLILIGEGELESHYRKLAIDLDINKRVFFLGKRSDVPSITKSVDICVLSSNWEGFGLVVVEAMAAGKPVIASKVPGLENVVKDAGILFEKGDYEELANNIEKVLCDKDLYFTLCNKGVLKSKKYNIYDMTVKYLETYNRLIRER